jgi:hypothetical protein
MNKPHPPIPQKTEGLSTFGYSFPRLFLSLRYTSPTLSGKRRGQILSAIYLTFVLGSWFFVLCCSFFVYGVSVLLGDAPVAGGLCTA